MIKANQKKTLKKLLSLAPVPEEAFTYDELLGYLFGIAITPDLILPSEWQPHIFGGESPVYDSMKQAQEMQTCLFEVYNAFNAAFHAGTLAFPYDFSNLRPKNFESIGEWVLGFEAALALRPELWEPEESRLPREMVDDVFSSLMVIQGLTDPEAADEIFGGLTGELSKDGFPGLDFFGDDDSSAQLYALLVASLPNAVETLQNYAKFIENKRQRNLAGKSAPIPIRSVKTGRNDPCPCKSGKKYKKCCSNGQEDSATVAPPAAPAKKAKIIHGVFPQHPKKTAAPAPVYQLKIALQGTKPPIWRRVQVPGATNLFDLHTIIQDCMGWTDSHLHQFIIARTAYCLPDEEDLWRETRDERAYTLHDLEKEIQPSFRYIYDFGDDWDHKITVEKILGPEEGSPHAVLLTGKRTCPPEDVGGVYGFMDCLEILGDPDHSEHEETLEWLGEDFQPEKFGKAEIAEINTILKNRK